MEFSQILNTQQFSSSEKVILAQELWDCVAIEQQALEVTEEQKNELDRRLAQFEESAEESSSWQEVKNRCVF